MACQSIQSATRENPCGVAGRPVTLAAAMGILLLSAGPVRAQSGAEPKDAAVEDSQAADSRDAELESLKKRLDALEQSRAAEQAEKEALQKRLEAVESNPSEGGNTELEERVDSLETSQIEQMQEEERKLKIFGFADVQWYKFWYKKDSAYTNSLNDNNSFAVAHWNLFMEKRLSEQFRVLGEVRFLFQPYGEELSVDSELWGTEWERANVKATDWVDAYYFEWGGISIERFWIEYHPNDYFGVKAGMYLTPYGVWNVDHGSTVVIPAHRPFISTARLLPESQTGLYLYGRAFPSDKTAIDYGLTLSNGRGPTTKLYDLDESKALGGLLTFSYDGPVVALSFGTYLFIGESTDITRGNGFDAATGQSTNYINTVYNYIEKSMSFYLKFEAAGFLLQSEFVRGLIRYEEGGRALYFEMSDTLAYYLPDFIQQGAYVLAAYRLPFDAVSISPYFIYEYGEPDPMSALPSGHNFGGGINWRITPAVVWKVEGFHHHANKSLFGLQAERLHYNVVSTQLAVSY